MAVGNKGMGRNRRHILGRSLLASGLIAGICVSSAALLPAQVAGATTASVSSCSGSASVAGSLPYEVANASSGDTINFSVSCPPSSPITLTSTLDITQNVTIDGPGRTSLAVSGNNAVGVIQVTGGVAASISGVTIENGNATATPGYGGGIFNSGGTLTISHSTISGNSAGVGGGGIYSNSYGTLTVNDCTITGNTLSGSGVGGGIVNSFANLAMTNSTISGNSAPTSGGSGGGIYNYGATVTIAGSTISGNTSANGGGFYVYGSGVTVTNSTISGNTAVVGGGIDNPFGGVTLTNSTISANSASSSGGGIYNYGSTFNVGSSILASNSGGDCYRFNGTLTSTGYNLDADGTCGLPDGTSISNVSAGLDPTGLQNNGGPTLTVALEAGSPAITAVKVAGLCSTADQRGVARPFPCDIGAYQDQGNSQIISFTSTPPTIGVAGGPIYLASATSTSGLPVSLTIDGSAGFACSISSGTVSFTGAGTCIVDANQPGNANYAPAQLVQQLILVDPILITTRSLPSGKSSTAYTATLAAIGGHPPYMWKQVSGVLPHGFRLNKLTGVISGITKQTGTRRVPTVAATDRS